jgi:hypothetical protein
METVMTTHRKKIIGLAVFISLAVTALPVSATEYETDKCGPMCHLPLDVHGVNSGKYLGPRSGSFSDMKRHFNIGQEQSKAWNKFQTAVMDRMLTAFDSETFTTDGLNVRPEDVDSETYAPVMSVELLDKWKKVLDTYDEMKGVLDKDRKAVAERISMICEQVK